MAFMRACLVPENLPAEIHSVETAYVNRSHKIGMFTDRDEAVAWLTAG
jgi:hypothetical protein